jgi:hypothetical protein
MSCQDSRYKCGSILPSSCIPYTGPTLTFLTEETQLECDANINDVFGAMDTEIKVLKDNTDLADLNLHCLTLAGDEEVTSFNVHQAEIVKICETEADLAALTTQFNNLAIGDESVTITLPECLVEEAAPCATGVNTYSLLALLNLFAAKLCDHETRISNLE